ncbi:hypothetical protein OCC_07978 [Thermococcus litoralis DSM 5473]|uniref:Water stress and hypersensitive response domain-containing protein n=1 Tax=Thermococcus litoralis (strain ATCC 51850 / DSM 5473 / JCM 8560 / NS-C) TaxID=523849 RepID=H3ZKY8_THELN|nr:LEA type 2 family protein [Thermococcus litoralis]EHR79389.1 hypothetical protein OCC_07978 [Thermococcus litoralis DSM 5473]
MEKMKLTCGLVVVLLLSVAFAGCTQKGTSLNTSSTTTTQILEKPEIKLIKHKWREITHSTTEIITEITIYNPNAVPIPIENALVEVYMNDIKLGAGSSTIGEIKAKSESTIVISTKFDNSKIPEWWVSHIKNGEKSIMRIKGFLTFNLKVTKVQFPIEFSSPLKTSILAGLNSDTPQKVSIGPITLTIESIKSHWGDVTADYTEIITLATIYNDNLIPVPITKLRYLVEMNGIKIAEGSSNVATIIQPKSDATLTFVTKLDNRMLDEWWVSHIKNGERTKVRVILQPVIEVGGRELVFTLAESESEFTTNLLGG